MNAKTLLRPLALLALASGCATTAEPPAELVRARNDYHAAANGPAAQLDPASLYTARKHLDRAELAFADTPNDPWVRDQAYIADRKALFADAQARMLLAQRQEAMARSQLEDLAASATAELRKSRASNQSTAAQLAAERAALEDARRRGQMTADELSTKEAELAATAEELAAERAARATADAALAEEQAKSQAALDELARTAQVVEDARGLVITLSGQVLFAFGESTLLPASRDALDNVAEALKANPDRAITVEGHTDSVGSDRFNEQLSQRRADAVREYLVSQGVSSDIIKARGVGEETPVTTNDTPEGRANNRRVEIVLAPVEPTPTSTPAP